MHDPLTALIRTAPQYAELVRERTTRTKDFYSAAFSLTAALNAQLASTPARRAPQAPAN